jgi:hypothetical protein
VRERVDADRLCSLSRLRERRWGGAFSAARPRDSLFSLSRLRERAGVRERVDAGRLCSLSRLRERAGVRERVDAGRL